MTATTFATALAAARQRAGWSQSHLAAECGWDHSLVCRYEAGKRHPSRDSVERMCDVLELDTYHAGLLLVAAGFVPAGPDWWLCYGPSGRDTEPEIVALAADEREGV